MLRLPDAVIIGLAAMIGAGVFSAISPATASAGSYVLLALVIAGIVAWCNANSSARLAALYPETGGTYVYGRRRLGEFPGYLAGWCFVIGKTASCAAMAMVFAAYAAPTWSKPAAALAIAALTLLNMAGIAKTALITRIIVACTITILIAVIALTATTSAPAATSTTAFDLRGVLQAAGLLFFSFAGYARIATLGGEVRDPSRTIPRAIGIALPITLILYLAVAAAVLHASSGTAVAGSSAPLADAVRTAGHAGFAPVVQVGAAIAALGSLIALILGVSRTARVMADDGYLPKPLGHFAFLGAAMIALVLLIDLRGAIGFSSFGVLLYYAIANASALTLPRRRWIATLGLLGCLVLVFTLPWTSVWSGLLVVALGALWFGLQKVPAVRRWYGSPPRAS